jgi:predicted O-methyltransferase YrrM
MTTIEQLIRQRPSFHDPETEISRAFDPRESLLARAEAQRLSLAGLTCYGIGADVLTFIADTIGEESKTLETGAGCSTLVFGAKGAQHVAVTPSKAEISRISEYAANHGIALGNVTFEPQSSEEYLPHCGLAGLDLVLLDGKHAFPWPVVDWFFTADRLRNGGVMIIDDAHMRSVSVLAEFMSVDPGWKLVQDFNGRTMAFRKMRESIHDVAWHMQPYTVAGVPSVGSVGLISKIASRFKL